jgi:DNA-binding NarL/FixJ family response regulator
MLETSETAPPAARRDRSLAARRAARQAKASRESRIVEGLNRGVSLADIAEREHVGEKRMRVLVHEILARRVPKQPAEFVATQVSPSRSGAPRVL